MNDLEHGWVTGGYDNDERDEDDVFCYCEWCDDPIYYNDDYHVVDGDRICCECHEKHEDELMRKEMYGDDEQGMD